LTHVYESLLSQLLASNQVPAARRVLASLPATGRSSATIKRLREVLTLPTLRSSTPATAAGGGDLKWLSDHAAAFKGRWVAVANGALVDSDESLKVLLGRVKTHSPKVLVHRL
jgi:hypothetical protein